MRNFYKTRWVVLACFALIIAVFPLLTRAQVIDESVPQPIKKVTLGKFYNNSLYKFKMKIPKGWVADDTNQIMIDFFDAKGRPLDAIGSRLSLWVVQLPAEISFDADVKAFRSTITQSYPGYTMLEDKVSKVSGLKAHVFDGTFSDQDEKIRIRTLMTMQKGRRFVIQVIGTNKEWVMNKNTYLQILKSFAFVK